MACESDTLLSWIECHPGTAGWVQAIGAIVALAIAIFVPLWMARSTDRTKQRRFLESVASIGGEAQECFANAAMHCGAGSSEGETFVLSVDAYHRFRIVSAAINAIPVHQIPNYELTRSVLELQRMTAEGLMQLDTASQEISSHGALVQAAAYGAAFSHLATRAHPCLVMIEAAALRKGRRKT
jgi:hypothetical protein